MNSSLFTRLIISALVVGQLSCISGGPNRDNNFNAIASNFSASAASFIFNSDCEPITLSIKDDIFNSKALTQSVTISVENSSTTTKLYSNSGCTTQITSLSIPSGSSSFTFYVQSTATSNETVVLSLLDENQVLTNKVTFVISFLKGIFFYSAGLTTGSIGGISGANATCTDKLADQYTGSSPNIRAYLADGTQALTAIPAPAGIKVYGLTVRDEEIADTFAALTNAATTSLEKSLSEAKVATSPWWSGAEADGTAAADHCTNWSTELDTTNGRKGSDDTVNGTWIADGEEGCDNENILLCIVY
ncbi:MAG: hypothetical protein R3A11_08400 [Bdellovibrionota bacterium]